MKLHSRFILFGLLFTGAVGLTHFAYAEIPIVSDITSPSGKYLVRVYPGNYTGDIDGNITVPGRDHARATYYNLGGKQKRKPTREIVLENPIAPASYFVTNKGSLVTFDNWQNLGAGKVIVVYKHDGTIQKSYALMDLYTADQIKQIPKSGSTIWWRCGGEPVLEPSTNRIVFRDAVGNVVELNPDSGEIRNVDKHPGC